MDEIKTDWFPPTELPVNPGPYEVAIAVDLISEEVVLANWERHLGQWGFWRVASWLDHTRTEMLTPLRWRGRLLPKRTPLIVDPPARRRAVLLP